ncbi:MAG: hypothetical protein KBD66_02125 [Candidatus Doudnabacteria bacterium]|nr:hypothetical protein [Candidatus Doudnabacteria bacterium]
MDAYEALETLGGIVGGLGFRWKDLKTNRRNAQYKFTRKPAKHQWLTVVVWTAVTAEGPLPDKKVPIQILLFGNTLAERYVWTFSETKRFRKRKERFRTRLHRRAVLAAELSDSVVPCSQHPGPLPLRVFDDRVAWTCMAPGCAHRGYVPEKLSKQLKRHTPQSFWKRRSI